MNNFTKIVTGWVRQYFEPNEDGTFVCTGQEFKAGDLCEYEDDGGQPIDIQMHQYQPYDMQQPESEQQQTDLLVAAQEIVSDFENYGEVLQTGFDGEYGKDTAIYKLSAAVKQIEGV